MAADDPIGVVKAVSLDARYISAWNEMNVRIAQRQSLITIYLTLAFTSLGAATAQVQPSIQFSTWRIAYLVPAATLIFTSLLYMHEQMMHHLQVFLARCEAYSFESNVPMYHRVGPHTPFVRPARILHDYVCAGLVIGLNALAAAVVVNLQKSPVNPYDPPVQVALLGVVLVALAQIRRISVFRFNPERGLNPKPPKREENDPH